MADIKIGVIGCGGRMGRMLLAEIAAADSCVLSGGTASPGSAYIGGDLGELAGLGRIGIAANIEPWPTIESPAGDVRDVIGYQIVA